MLFIIVSQVDIHAHLRAGLMTLPEPKNDFEIVLPEEVHIHVLYVHVCFHVVYTFVIHTCTCTLYVLHVHAYMYSW